MDVAVTKRGGHLVAGPRGAQQDVGGSQAGRAAVRLAGGARRAPPRTAFLRSIPSRSAQASMAADGVEPRGAVWLMLASRRARLLSVRLVGR